MHRTRSTRAESGFTLVEVLVVILVIGVLIAIGLPTFLATRTRAEDRALQTDLRTSLAAAMTWWAESGTYDGFDQTSAKTSEPSLDWQNAGDPAQDGQIAIEIAAGPNLLLVARSKSGTYFCMSQVANNPATDRGRGVTFADVDTVSECTGGW
jgi:prepilin-type N-terminal cleavage/methylation domain-containing protein